MCLELCALKTCAGQHIPHKISTGISERIFEESVDLVSIYPMWMLMQEKPECTRV